MIKRLALLILSLTSLLVIVSTPAYAAFDFFSACNSDTANTAACRDNTGNNPLSGPGGLLVNIADIIAYIAGAAAIILLVISGIRFITSSGDPEKIRSARSTATGALIGVAVIVLAHTLIVFVLDRIKL